MDQLLAVGGALALLTWAGRWAAATKPATRFALIPAFREEAVFLAALAYFGTALFLSALMRAARVPPDSVLFGLTVNNGAQLGGVVACLVLAWRYFPGRLHGFFFGAPGNPGEPAPAGTNLPSRRAWIDAMVLMVAALGVCPLLRDGTVWLIERAAPGFAFELHPTLKALEQGGLGPIETAALWTGAAVIAPVAEEMFFRGILLNFLLKSTRRAGLSLGISATVFGLIHVSQPHAVPALILLGVLLGIAYLRSGVILVPVVMHAAFNLKTLVWESMR